MDWVQCNNCGVKPNSTKMYLTACGHIFCQSCVEKAKESQCYLCKKQLKVDEINKSLRPELMELFKDPRQVATDLINELKQVATFQAKQREIYMKFKNSEMKKETEKYNEARNRQTKMTREIEKRKKSFSDDNARLIAAKEERKRLTAILQDLRNDKSMKTGTLISRQSHTRTEPPITKSARVRPPPGVNRKSSHDFPLSLLDQSTSKIVTSTPIISVDFSRRDHMNRMFGAGLEHPSPILRH